MKGTDTKKFCLLAYRYGRGNGMAKKFGDA
jgi:hypothetical protein